MIEEGYVHDVRLVTLGSFLDGDHLTGSTTLKIMDAADFNEEGGSLILDGLTLDYVSADLEADALELASPLAADYEDGVPLSTSPLTYEKQAVVVLDDFDEALTVSVPHSLHDRLAEGMREDFNRESVTVELRNGTWYIDNVYGKEPVIDGQYLENVVADDVIDGIVTTLKLADDAVTQAKIAVGAVGTNELLNEAINASKIAADAVTNAAIADGAVNPSNLSAALGTSVMQRWTDDFDSSDAWTITLNTGAAWSIVNTGSAQVGGNVGQATGYVTALGKNLIAYDPNTLYRVSVRMRTTVQPSSGPDNVYLGVAGYAADKVTYVNRDGANSQSAMYYPAALLQPVGTADGWVTYTGYLKGRAPAGSSAPGGPANDIQNPFTVHDQVRYIAPWLLFNYTTRDNTSVMQVDSVSIEALRTGVVTANELAANSVTAGKIVAGAVGADQLAANAVVAGKIAALAIQAGNIAAGAIQTDDLAANAITGSKIAGLTITGDKIAANTIDASNIKAGAITADKLDANAINGKTITGGSLNGTAINGGTLVIGPSGLPQTTITSDSSAGMVKFPTNRASESRNGLIIGAVLNKGLASEYLSLQVQGPSATSPANDRISVLISSQNNDGTSNANMSVVSNAYGALLLVDKDGFNFQRKVTINPSNTPNAPSLYVYADASQTADLFVVQTSSTVKLAARANGDVYAGGNFIDSSYSGAMLDLIQDWTTPSLYTGYTHNGNSNGTVQYRVYSMYGTTYVEWRGGIGIPYTSGTANNAGNYLSSALPAAYRPSVRRTVSAACSASTSSNNSVKIDFDIDGSAGLVMKSADTPPWVSLNGIRYTL